uniref:CCHC-type domain-containing protein n=1 Tax=Fagus sylvatica TaxID=28930 RepID=A0A2N9HAC8_FAGSY
MAEELTLEQIGTHLQIEEESRIRKGTNSVSKVNEGTVNYVQNGGVGSSKTHKSFKPNKKTFKKTNSNKEKKGRACFHCGKKGHYIRECRFLKNQIKEKELNTSEANVVDEIVAMEYVEAGSGLEVLMGNHNIAKVLGTGTVELILSSGKKLKLTNVYHVPDIKKNLVSASLLSKNGVKAVLESDKLILSKCEGNREKVLSKLPFVGNVEEDPNTYSETMASRDAVFWREAINDEMDSILSNNTWVLVDLPSGSNTIGCKWVFRRKYRTDGTIQTFKARITSIRVLIALASIYKLVVHQMDIKIAFLNGDLDEEVYMDQPEGFVLLGNEKKVCVCETKKYLASVFKMKDLNEADTILGIKVKRHSEGYALCQSHYIEKVLLTYKHLNVKEVNTPFDSNYKLVENTERAIAQLEFASAIRSMMYAMHCTRLDIAFAVNRLSRYTSNPSAEHWKAIARVLGYLKKTKDLGLYYSGYPAVLEGYSDANWVTSVGDNKSTSGWIFTLGGGKKAKWLRNMLYDIELWPQSMLAISIYCDSQATMSKAYSKIYNGKSRHISLRHEYVRQLIEDGVISIVYVKSSGNLADPFTKGLSRDMIRVTSIRNGTKTFLKESPTVGTQP